MWKVVKKDDRFCQFDPVRRYLVKTCYHFDNAIFTLLAMDPGTNCDFMSEDTDLSEWNLITQGTVAVTVIELIQ